MSVNRQLPEPRIHSIEEPARVAGRVGFVVIVEVDVDIGAARAPAVDERGPFVELAVGVARGVELARAVQAHIREIVGGALERERMVIGGVGGGGGGGGFVYWEEGLFPEPRRGGGLQRGGARARLGRGGGPRRGGGGGGGG